MIEEFFNRQENGVKVYKVYIIRHEISPARRILKGSGGGWGIPRKKAYKPFVRDFLSPFFSHNLCFCPCQEKMLHFVKFFLRPVDQAPFKTPRMACQGVF